MILKRYPLSRRPDAQAVIDMIRKERERRGISQRQLAKRLGISQSFLSAIERHASRDITLNTLVKIAHELGGVVTVQFGVTDVQSTAEPSTDEYTAETPRPEEP
jgi:transcriptional regulator with XRE-family HTH domain